jgi:phosphoribosylanthranilate isomerase
MARDAALRFKVCGLSRPADARLAESLGAHFLGFIFARSPRQLSVEWAEALLRALDAAPGAATGAGRARRVGVFGAQEPAAVATVTQRLGLDIAQLHGVADARRLSALRSLTEAALWSVVPVEGDRVDERALEVAYAADGILLDAKVGGRVGGTGSPFDWDAVARTLEPLRGTRPIILAGGLSASNVAMAASLIHPDVVDVSSGVEARPGRKDPDRLRAFAHAVRGVAAA